MLVCQRVTYDCVSSQISNDSTSLHSETDQIAVEALFHCQHQAATSNFCGTMLVAWQHGLETGRYSVSSIGGRHGNLEAGYSEARNIRM